MTKPNSPWAATAATNPAAIGAVSIRAVALRIAKQKVEHDLYIPPMLFTSKSLNEAGVKQ
jgi:simple sugar transport system substrate-binding protein|tara:strand:- start:802 stop:981 length:180 start_codon:yes stop_codon:yes gene_type:complete